MSFGHISSYGYNPIYVMSYIISYIKSHAATIATDKRGYPHNIFQISRQKPLGWSGGAKVSCILRHRGVQLILAYSWARPAILVAGKGRWGIFLFILFLHFHSCSFLPCPSL